ncbi:hypothetical protein BDB00DRAFT_820143 [Zychaea mexicana]|uniref:uncharacterized protein n=1 Tax=Zychaea mexicana TaxID=64656 RepID=UPI0022FF1B8B|nr:uncharacterized protein BDB00DRAFT_820143 [Zychaea mexicana]KAI9494209.1 hypothetical protein BDB00DRAFT_820143 [Zychaea mexicana]
MSNAVMDEEDDPYNARIERTGCAQENEDLQICFYDKKDWRLCQKEMKRFRQCFQANTKNAGSQELKASQNQQQEQDK